jgi:hypothetical protein
VVRSIPKEMRPPVRDHSTPEAGLLKESRGFIITTATRTFLLKRSFQNEGLVLIQYLATVNLTVPKFLSNRAKIEKCKIKWKKFPYQTRKGK